MGGPRLPRHAETVVVGGGTAGTAMAARLAVGSAGSVLLLEAGPDYGPYGGGRWPAALLDPCVMPVEGHGWDYTSAAAHGVPGLALERARVIGGCSAHNGCAAVWGHRADYDAWEALGNPGWGAEALVPLFREVDRMLRVHTPGRDELTPWHRVCLDAGPGAGLPEVGELNDLDLELGIAIGPLNTWGGVRWNSAFAYLDPVRDRPNLTVVGDALVDRLAIERGRAVGVEVVGPGGREMVAADRVVVAAGAYGSPLLLLRSGIGPAAELRAVGVEPVHDLPGVGRNLQDHPAARVEFAGTPGLDEAMAAFTAGGGLPREEGTIALARSSLCERAFDLHLYPLNSRAPRGERAAGGGQTAWRYSISAAVMTPRSRGSVRLAGRDPSAPPVIDHAYLSDDADHDLAVLLDGIELIRELASQSPLSRSVEAELAPGPDFLDREALRARVRTTSVHDYHPVGTCAMGPASDPAAVVDHRGRVHGLDGLLVADASIMPVVPRANTNLPVAVVAEKVAGLMLGGDEG